MQKAVTHLTTALCPSRPSTSFPPNELEESPVLIDYSHQITKEMTSKFSMKFLGVNTFILQVQKLDTCKMSVQCSE